MLLDLSVELLEATERSRTQLSQSDHAILRTTHQNGLTEDGVQMLKALATGGTGWSVYARTVRMKRAKVIVEEGACYDTPVDLLLASSLASLSNIQTVVWHLQDHIFWAWGRTVILDFLNALATVENLELNILGLIKVPPLQVRSLRKFTLINSGQGPSSRRRLHGPIRTPSQWRPPMHQDISLHLEGANHWSAIWRMLRSGPEGARSTEITTNVVTKELFDYLTSYSGLEKLTLVSPDGGNLDESNRLADTFFETVLPHHAESLTELSCAAAYESRFSFGTHNVHVISLLHKLTKLEMSINAGAVRFVPTYKDEEGLWEPIVTVGLALEIEQADIDTVVVSILLHRL
ncbi:hypothetical protein C8R45DRAFT_1047839 [Mycena sanguinolenta]|nr:hypothetical protein C8R45DRAFT_1047839 [Mycena sanguinolenta]